MAKRRSHGEGTIYHRKDGRWEAAISLGDGRRKRMTAKTQKDARELLTRAQRDRDQGLPIMRDERQTVARYLASWLQIAKPTMRPGTYRNNAAIVRNHLTPTLGRVQLAKLSPQVVQQLYAAKLDSGLSAGTVRNIHNTLGRALGEALQLGVIHRNVATLVKPPKMRHHEIHVLTTEQARQLLTATTGNRLAALYLLALLTGMRQGELLALRWRDIDLAGGSLQVRATLSKTPGGAFVFAEPKSARSRRRITLSAPVVAALREHRTRQLAERLAAGPVWQESGVVFAMPDGQPINSNHLRKYCWPEVLRAAGLPRIRFHDLRHTAATLLLLRGVNPKIVSELLGHGSVAITLDIYSHVLPDMQQQAADVMAALLGADGALSAL